MSRLFSGLTKRWSLRRRIRFWVRVNLRVLYVRIGEWLGIDFSE